MFIGTQAGATINWKHAFNFRVRPGNNVNTDQFTDPTRSGSARIGGSLYRTNISAHEDRNVAGADIFLSQELNIRGLDHRIRSLYRSDETFGFDHSECF
jgi:hypothetical protein